VVFAVTPEEIQNADKYEVAAVKQHARTGSRHHGIATAFPAISAPILMTAARLSL
jgi:hypothetical protein